MSLFSRRSRRRHRNRLTPWFRFRLFLKRVSWPTGLLFCLAISNALAPGWMRFHVGIAVLDVSEGFIYFRDYAGQLFSSFH
jgi:hypothetical protein